MPITIPDGLPAKGILEDERIFALEEDVASKQDIRPLNVLLLNLMPKKIETETQILRLISKSPLQVHVDFMHMGSHASKNTPSDHLVRFYETFDELKGTKYDGLIVTGCRRWSTWRSSGRGRLGRDGAAILDWSRENVFSTLHICWGALAGLYRHFGIRKATLPQKLFGSLSPSAVRRVPVPHQRLRRGVPHASLPPCRL